MVRGQTLVPYFFSNTKRSNDPLGFKAIFQLRKLEYVYIQYIQYILLVFNKVAATRQLKNLPKALQEI